MSEDRASRNLASWDPRRLLDSALLYRLVQHALAPRASFVSFVEDYVRPAPGARVLDIGCGPADDLAYMGDVAYVGFDMSAQYIAAARRRWGNRGRFFEARVSADLLSDERFDVVIANGVLHHLSDSEARDLVLLARSVLDTAGVLVTKDPAYVDGQSAIAKFLIDRDRGEGVRTPEEYGVLARAAFEEVQLTVRTDLLRLPYTHAILRCRTGDAATKQTS